jgi:hypothetical protein
MATLVAEDGAETAWLGLHITRAAIPLLLEALLLQGPLHLTQWQAGQCHSAEASVPSDADALESPACSCPPSTQQRACDSRGQPLQAMMASVPSPCISWGREVHGEFCPGHLLIRLAGLPQDSVTAH